MIFKIFNFRAFIGLFFATLVWSQPSFAIKESELRIGAQGGNVNLLGDVGNSGQNGMGFGAVVDYAVTEEILFEVGYLTSAHESVNHTDLSLGINLNLNNYDVAYGYVSGGASFLSNSFSNPSITGSAFGVYVGGGFDFELGRNFVTGIQLKHQKAFEATKSVSGVAVKTVQDSTTVLLRFMFTFGGDGW
jgi:hypothetical protein